MMQPAMAWLLRTGLPGASRGFGSLEQALKAGLASASHGSDGVWPDLGSLATGQQQRGYAGAADGDEVFGTAAAPQSPRRGRGIDGAGAKASHGQHPFSRRDRRPQFNPALTPEQAEAQATSIRVMQAISRAGSLEALEGAIVTNAPHFGHEHVALAMVRLTALVDGDVLGGPQPVARGPARMEALERAQRLLAGLCAALMRFSNDIGSREISTALRCLALVRPAQRGELTEQLLGLLLADDAKRLKQATAVEIAITNFSLSKLQISVLYKPAGGTDGAALVERAWAALSAEVAQRAPEMSAAQVASTAWAFAVATRDCAMAGVRNNPLGSDQYSQAISSPTAEVLKGLVPRVVELLPSMEPRDLVNLTFAYAQQRHAAFCARKSQARRQLWGFWLQHKAQQQPQEQQKEQVYEVTAESKRAVDEVFAASEAALDAAADAIRNTLPAFMPWQLCAVLSSQRYSGRVNDQLLEAAVPRVLQAAHYYGAERDLSPASWNDSLKHLSQLVHGYAPIVKVPRHASAFWEPDEELAGPMGGSGGGGEDEEQAGGIGGGALDAGRSIDGSDASSDESDDDAAVAAADSGDGGGSSQAAGARREVVVAVIGAFERLLQRAEQHRQSLQPMVPLQGADAGAPDGADGAAPMRPLPPGGQRQRLRIELKHVLPMVKVASIVCPDEGLPLARAVATHVLRARQLPMTNSWNLRILLHSLPAAGLTNASAVGGEFYPALFDAMAPEVLPLAPQHRAWVTSAASCISPPPAGMLQLLAGTLQDDAANMSMYQVRYVVDALATAAPQWRALRAALRASGGAPLPEGSLLPPGAPEHWAWDLSRPVPAGLVASNGGAAAEGAQRDPVERIAAAMASVIETAGPAVFVRLPQRHGDSGSSGSSTGTISAAALQRYRARQQLFCSMLVKLQAIGHDDPAFYARLIEPGLKPKGGLDDAQPECISQLLRATANACGSTAEAGGSAGADTAAAVDSVVAQLAAKLQPQALSEVSPDELVQLRQALPQLTGWCSSGGAAGVEALLGRLDAAVEAAVSA